MSGRRRGGWLDRGRAALVDPGIARPEAGQHFVTDGAEMVREFVDRDALANQRHHVAAPHGVFLKIGDVDGHQVLRDAARNRTALAGDHYLGTARAVVTAGGAEISVGIAGRYDREPGRPPRGPRSAITDAVAFLDIADVHDAGFQIDDRLHRIIGFRRRVDPVERGARPHQVEQELRREENPGGIRQRGRYAREQAGDLAEGFELLGAGWMIESRVAGEVAYHQRVAGV